MCTPELWYCPCLTSDRLLRTGDHRKVVLSMLRDFLLSIISPVTASLISWLIKQPQGVLPDSWLINMHTTCQNGVVTKLWLLGVGVKWWAQTILRYKSWDRKFWVLHVQIWWCDNAGGGWLWDIFVCGGAWNFAILRHFNYPTSHNRWQLSNTLPTKETYFTKFTAWFPVYTYRIAFRDENIFQCSR